MNRQPTMNWAARIYLYEKKMKAFPPSTKNTKNWERPDASSTQERKVKYSHCQKRKRESRFQYTGTFAHAFTWHCLGWHFWHLRCYYCLLSQQTNEHDVREFRLSFSVYRQLSLWLLFLNPGGCLTTSHISRTWPNYMNLWPEFPIFRHSVTSPQKFLFIYLFLLGSGLSLE